MAEIQIKNIHWNDAVIILAGQPIAVIELLGGVGEITQSGFAVVYSTMLANCGLLVIWLVVNNVMPCRRYP